MPKSRNQDLFEQSRMSFGEHLDELRWTLVKVCGALLLGFIVGLFFAETVVEYIQSPLRESLTTYYKTQGKVELAKQLAAQRGRDVPNVVDEEDAEELVESDGLLAEKKYIDIEALVSALRERFPSIPTVKSLQQKADIQDAVSPSSHKQAKGSNEKKLNADGPLSRHKNWVEVLLYHSVESDARIRVIGLSVYEAFMVFIKAALAIGLVLSSPAVFYFIWEFVGAGLYPHEKSYVYTFLPISICLFLSGVFLAFFVVLEFVINYLFTFNASMGIDPDPRIGEWISFVLMLPLGFGIAFQLPLVMLFLNRIGIFSIENYIARWRIAILVITFLSGLLSPPDPTSMVMLAIPLTALYFGGIGLCKYLPKRKTPFGTEIKK